MCYLLFVDLQEDATSGSNKLKIEKYRLDNVEANLRKGKKKYFEGLEQKLGYSALRV